LRHSTSFALPNELRIDLVVTGHANLGRVLASRGGKNIEKKDDSQQKKYFECIRVGKARARQRRAASRSMIVVGGFHSPAQGGQRALG